ncbi:hypothetical protein PAPYR_10999 [Paratrimastix pyriformis]|uniref:Uncharacterized protein n=1 Tax=Paratrimastix pyriformis TaxID=342808 RepID=A0ABQ8U8L8_9EUKA|nr:hypothetical protein PAPYR_10999 [Paratrimastix pyriformis]
MECRLRGTSEWPRGLLHTANKPGLRGAGAHTQASSTCHPPGYTPRPGGPPGLATPAAPGWALPYYPIGTPDPGPGGPPGGPSDGDGAIFYTRGVRVLSNDPVHISYYYFTHHIRHRHPSQGRVKPILPPPADDAEPADEEANKIEPNKPLENDKPPPQPPSLPSFILFFPLAPAPAPVPPAAVREKPKSFPIPAWSLRHDLTVPFAPVLLRSHHWPGAFVLAYGGPRITHAWTTQSPPQLVVYHPLPRGLLHLFVSRRGALEQAPLGGQVALKFRLPAEPAVVPTKLSEGHTVEELVVPALTPPIGPSWA